MEERTVHLTRRFNFQSETSMNASMASQIELPFVQVGSSFVNFRSQIGETEEVETYIFNLPIFIIKQEYEKNQYIEEEPIINNVLTNFASLIEQRNFIMSHTSKDIILMKERLDLDKTCYKIPLFIMSKVFNLIQIEMEKPKQLYDVVSRNKKSSAQNLNEFIKPFEEVNAETKQHLSDALKTLKQDESLVAKKLPGNDIDINHELLVTRSFPKEEPNSLVEKTFIPSSRLCNFMWNARIEPNEKELAEICKTDLDLYGIEPERITLDDLSEIISDEIEEYLKYVYQLYSDFQNEKIISENSKFTKESQLELIDWFFIKSDHEDCQNFLNCLYEEVKNYIKNNNNSIERSWGKIIYKNSELKLIFKHFDSIRA